LEAAGTEKSLTILGADDLPAPAFLVDRSGKNIFIAFDLPGSGDLYSVSVPRIGFWRRLGQHDGGEASLRSVST